MSSKTYTTTIAGNDYAYTQLSAKDSLKLKFKLAGIIGQAAGNIAQALGQSEEEQMQSFGEAMSKIFKENNPDDIVALIEKIFIPAFRGGERINIDKHYQGSFSELYQALLWVLKMEYGSFLEDARSIL